MRKFLMILTLAISALVASTAAVALDPPECDVCPWVR